MMKLFKQFLLILIAFMLALSLVSCKSGDSDSDAESEQEETEKEWLGYEESNLGDYIALGKYYGLTYDVEAEEVTEEDLNTYLSSIGEPDADEERREEVYSEMKTNAAKSYVTDVKDYLWSTAVTNCYFDSLPEEELEYYRQDLISYYEDYASDNDMTLETLLDYIDCSQETFDETVEAYAETNVKSNIFLYAMTQKENITISDSEYESGLELLAEQNNYDDVEAYESKYGRDVIMRSLLKEKAIGYIFGNASPADENDSGND